MRLGKRKPPPPPPKEDTSKPAWHKHLEDDERPSREDRAAGHNVFMDSILEPVPLPRWLRGKRPPSRDKLS